VVLCRPDLQFQEQSVLANSRGLLTPLGFLLDMLLWQRVFLFPNIHWPYTGVGEATTGSLDGPEFPVEDIRFLSRRVCSATVSYIGACVGILDGDSLYKLKRAPLRGDGQKKPRMFVCISVC